MEAGLIYISVDITFFLIMALQVLYLLIYAIASLKKCHPDYPVTDYKYSILVLFPAYKEDAVILHSVLNFKSYQNYPSDLYRIVVISDGMKEETNIALRNLGTTVLEADYSNSTKAKALKLAMGKTSPGDYDIVVIMDADNTVQPDFLLKITGAYDAGCKAVQAHRVAKNINTDIAILDALSEEINNSVFRKGHVNLGVSSALIGSGMAFDFEWLRENIQKIKTLPEERELEVLLLRQKVYVEYLENVKVFDEKTQKESVFYKQRRRWMASQLETLKSVIGELPGAVLSGNFSYSDKIIQWLILPRIVIIGILFILSVITTLSSPVCSIKWWILLLFMIFTMAISVPGYMINKRTVSALKRLPALFLLMFLNFFKMKNANKRWAHTEKNFN